MTQLARLTVGIYYLRITLVTVIIMGDKVMPTTNPTARKIKISHSNKLKPKESRHHVK